MKKQALQVEHKFKNRVVGVHLLEGVRTATIGSSRTADIRLLGDEVSGLHAAFDLLEEKWKLCDLGSKSGTWVNQKPVIEYDVEGATVIHIGNHQLKATPHILERELFATALDQGLGQNTYHQVVVLRKGLLHRSLLLDKSASYDTGLSEFGVVPAPTGGEWTVTEKGEWTVKQRLTKSDVLKGADSAVEESKRPTPAIAALVLVLLLIVATILVPQRPNDELKTLTPEMQNQYTRMIFDGQKVRQKKAVAEKMRKNLQGQSNQGVAKNTPGGDAGSKAAGGTKAPPGAKVVLNLKNAGLGAMIGKVAARAAKTASLVQSAGVSADSAASSGRALGLGGGSALDKLGGGGGGTGTTMKVGGLGTAGKGGGSSGYKGTGALSLGNIGNAEVGVLEEESEVDGGLDKEAIARVIRSQLGQIRYCYERQLSANPDLYGKIMVKFTIGAAGSVVAQAIGNTSLNNAMVEGCILRRIAGWQFPTPKGGTNVLVTYPFLFKSTK
ncbi:MAG: AgmX/PglI C-terminal domain-containing protein [Bdellovibrionales bacterium]|nr:AgmX/PglI C-terminal domain-containing protein [Bdellovibrionales bacterium]